MVVVWNGPALIRITLMRIQCGRMQRALLRIIMRIVGLVWIAFKSPAERLGKRSGLKRLVSIDPENEVVGVAKW